MLLAGYRIFRAEPLAETYRRVMREQIQLALDYCRKSGKEPDLATHEIRKCTKRIRATNRLFREVLGESAFRLSQDRFRNISRMLASHRISKVHLDVLSDIALAKQRQEDILITGKLRDEIRANHNRLTNDIIRKEKVYQQVRIILTDEMNRIQADPLASCDFVLLQNQIKKTYSKAKRNLQIIQNQYSAENLHNLRKTVKSLWNQILLIRPAWPSYVGMTVRYLDSLAEKLGYDHDLDDLMHDIAQRNEAGDPEKYKALTGYIILKRRRLEKSIIPLAVRIFSEKAGDFSRRMAAYYMTYRQGTRL